MQVRNFSSVDLARLADFPLEPAPRVELTIDEGLPFALVAPG